jgi:hypothetical protein
VGLTLGSDALNFFIIGGVLSIHRIRLNEKLDLWILTRDILFYIPSLFMLCYFNT